MTKIDFIGDIHGYADHLEKLLIKLGYSNTKGWFEHRERKVVFVGDYIDRGSKIRETLQIVKAMVDNGTATALMGNHEFNAICFNLENEKGGYQREHSIKNFKQHSETLLQFQNRQEEYNQYIEWFKTLPLFIENEHFRATHASWDNVQIEIIKEVLKGNKLENPALFFSNSSLENAMEIVLKGKELNLPKGHFFHDKDGHKRTKMRVKWWLEMNNKSYDELSFESLDLDNSICETDDTNYYKESEKPVFFGHYWLKGMPNLYRGNICCLYYSVAKEGYLTCYRFNGEKVLSDEHFVFV